MHNECKKVCQQQNVYNSQQLGLSSHYNNILVKKLFQICHNKKFGTKAPYLIVLLLKTQQTQCQKKL